MTEPEKPTAAAAQQLVARLASSAEDIAAAQRLRYRVFVQELGASGPMVDHGAQQERDDFDDFADHLLLLDKGRPDGDQVVGTYRLMTREQATSAGGFYCAGEYDLSALCDSGETLLELGRSCLDPAYRGGAGMLHLWAALARIAEARAITLLFGVASFHGTDLRTLAQPLSLLHHRHLAPVGLRPRAIGPSAHRMDMIAQEDIDRLAAVRQIPALIKAYLRLGGTVGEGVFVDTAFNTTDVCLVLQKDAISELHQAIYRKGGGRG